MPSSQPLILERVLSRSHVSTPGSVLTHQQCPPPAHLALRARALPEAARPVDQPRRLRLFGRDAQILDHLVPVLEEACVRARARHRALFVAARSPRVHADRVCSKQTGTQFNSTPPFVRTGSFKNNPSTLSPAIHPHLVFLLSAYNPEFHDTTLRGTTAFVHQ